MSIPESVGLKIRWAKEHFKVLQNIGCGYFEGKLGEIMVENSGCAAAVIAPPLPWELPMVLGDSLQSLRSSLDYLVWELCVAAKTPPTEKHAFPVCRTAKCFRNSVTTRQMNGLSTEMVASINSFQPYHAGDRSEQTPLWLLHELCNINKHRRILLTTITITFGYQGRTSPITKSETNAVEVDVNPEATALIALDEGPIKGLEISRLIAELIAYVEQVMLPQFEGFFH